MNSLVTSLCATAVSFLSREENQSALLCLRAALELDPTHLSAHNLLEKHRLEGNFTEAFAICAEIDPQDDIFRFFANHPSCRHPIRDYLADGWRTLAELMQLLEAIDRPLHRCSSFLEFASGFGRFSRHLARVLTPSRLHVSDVVPGSVTFIKSVIGVDGFYSSPIPEALNTPRSYEVIFVLSLFSHLPESTWSRWLKRLYDALEPNGVLIITTHGEKCARLTGVTIPDHGFLFMPSSESQALDGQEYGSSFTSSQFVHQAIRSTLGLVDVREFPAHFWGNQDGFAIIRSRQTPDKPGSGSREDALFELASRIVDDSRFKASVWRQCSRRLNSMDVACLKTLIHNEDQMLRHSLKHFDAANPSLSQYFNVALQQDYAAQQILRAFFDRPEQGLKILDFACGFGRLLRFLTLSVPAENIWAAEIQQNAANFVAREYGVHRLVSESDPAKFDPALRFDFIWVASLFSHLPESLFLAWLGKLYSLLSPKGVLCFSVHDEALLANDQRLPESGIAFTPQSENADLDVANYGTTYVNERFVAEAIKNVVGVSQRLVRIPRALANEQDIYVLPRSADSDLSRLNHFRKGPWGWVDEISFSRDGRIYLRGWAGSLDDGVIDSVVVRIDDRVSSCRTGLAREDVARVLGDVRLATSGWEFSETTMQAEVYVEVTVQTTHGESALLYTGPVRLAV